MRPLARERASADEPLGRLEHDGGRRDGLARHAGRPGSAGSGPAASGRGLAGAHDVVRSERRLRRGAVPGPAGCAIDPVRRERGAAVGGHDERLRKPDARRRTERVRDVERDGARQAHDDLARRRACADEAGRRRPRAVVVAQRPRAEPGRGEPDVARLAGKREEHRKRRGVRVLMCGRPAAEVRLDHGLQAAGRLGEPAREDVGVRVMAVALDVGDLGDAVARSRRGGCRGRAGAERQGTDRGRHGGEPGRRVLTC